MNCRNFRELAQEHVATFDVRDSGKVREPDALLELEKWGAGTTQHANECEHCMRHWRGLMLHARLLGSLEHLSAPGDLAGRVVAAVNAGYREARAARRVASLARLQPPPILARRVEHEFRVKAPAVLDRLVESQLEGDPKGSAAGRMLDLGSRLAGAPAVAAAAVLGLALWITLPDRSTSAAARRLEVQAGSAQYDFEIVRVDSMREASLDAGTMAWIDSVTGGGSR